MVLAFIVTWMPKFLQEILRIHIYLPLLKSKSNSPIPENDQMNCELEITFTDIVDKVTEVLCYSSPMINPIIYNLTSKKFREAFKVNFISIAWINNKRLVVSKSRMDFSFLLHCCFFSNFKRSIVRESNILEFISDQEYINSD